MPLKPDILHRIQSDFGESAEEAKEILIESISKVAYLRTDRVIRCIVFLSKGNLLDLRKYIETAIADTRDVMLWAEYEELPGNYNFKRLRNFNKTFEVCLLN
jgi:hypothetical protein